MNNKKNILVLMLTVILFLASHVHAQGKIFVFVKPLQAINVKETFANSATQQLRQALSQTGRFGNVSEEAWRQVMETEGIYLENIALFNREEDRKIAQLAKADVIIYGKLERAGARINLSLNYFDVEEGYDLFVFWDELDSESDLEEVIKNIVSRIISNIVPNGRIITINDEVVRIKIKMNPEEWNIGSVFNLKKPDGTIYGKVEIFQRDGKSALGKVRMSELSSPVEIGDIVEFSTQIMPKKRKKPNVGLVYFESDLPQSQKDDIYLNCQTQINKSFRVNLFDYRTVTEVLLGRSPVKLDYIVEGEIKKNYENGAFSVTIRLKDFATEQIIKQDYLKCSPEWLNQTIEVLLYTIIDYFPLQGEITRITEKEIQVNLGENHNIRKKMKFFVKAKDSETVICEGKVKEVYPNYFICKRDDKLHVASLGDIIEMRKDEKLKKRMKKLREKIGDEYFKYLENRAKQTYDKEERKRQKAKLDSLKRERKKQERLAPKSRLKFSLSKIKWEQDYQKVRFDGKKTTKFLAGLYLGSHPNFHIAFNYQYAYFEDQTRPKGSVGNSFISSQSYGAGARIQFVIPFLFSTCFMPYVEGFGQLSKFSPNLKQGTKILLSDEGWTAYYAFADAGVEFAFNRKFSFFGQVGVTRTIKSPEGKPKYEYFFIDGGIGIWF